jgi:predicted HTH transcriptional regulator
VQPEFRDYDGFFKAVFYNAEPDEGAIEREVEKLTEHQKIILHLIKNNPFISKKEMSETIGIRPSSIDKNIATLKGKRHLKRVGPANGGRWELIRKLD